MSAVDNPKRFLYVCLNNKLNKNRQLQACNKRYRRNIRNIKAQERKKIHFIGLFLLILNVPRERSVWMHPRTDVWFHLADQRFTDRQWYENFRVTKRTFLFVVDLVEDDVKRKSTVMREPVSVEKPVAIVYYFLATTAEYRTIANLFGVSRSFVCKCVKDVCAAVVNRLQSTFVFFPKEHELENIINTYKRKWGFPACVGALDGTHIPIIAPAQNHADYVSRKGYHSVVMQAVVDCNYLFRDIVDGWPGSVHDARVLSNSEIFRLGEQNRLFPEGYHVNVGGKDIAPVILGDPAYPLLLWLLRPYPENENTERKQRRFNYRLSRARVTVENAFGRWKGRFCRFLKS